MKPVSMKSKRKIAPKQLVLLLVIATGALFVGRGLQGVIWDYPLRSLLWDESLMTPIVAFFGWDWGDWVSSLAVDGAIQKSTRLTGWALVTIGLALSWPSLRKNRVGRMGIALGGCLLLAIILLATKDNFWRWGYLIEHALQLGTPWLLIAALRGRMATGWMRWLTAFTFIGHGLFAIGFYPIPANFTLMLSATVEGFFGTAAGAEFATSTAINLLFVVGLLDFLAAIMLLLPNKKAQLWSLYWIIPWAFLTTMARLWANGQFSSGSSFILHWVPAFLYRIPHFLIPVTIWFLLNGAKTTSAIDGEVVNAS